METLQLSSNSTKNFLVNVVTSNGGAGHYATYNALRSIVEQQQLPWEFNVTDVDVLGQRLAEQKKTLDLYRIFGTTSDKFINDAQKKGWKWIQRLTMRLNQLLIRLNYRAGMEILESQWKEQQPDLVVCVMPLFNKIVWDSLQRVKPGTPVVTVMTDFADSPPAFWIEPSTENYVVCGTQRAVEQARFLGVKSERIVKTSGMVINPRFYEPIKCDRRLERERLGLDPDCLTGLVLFGGYGTKAMLEIAERLSCFQQKLQLIFICGRNEELALALSQLQGQQKKLVMTFTKDIPYYMHLSDFFIGKPGPGSISEALAMKLPVIVEHNSGTLPQEQYNGDWIQENKVGLTIPSFSQIEKAVEKFCDPENYAVFRANVAAVNNQAVFEVPKILQKILAENNKEKVFETILKQQLT